MTLKQIIKEWISEQNNSLGYIVNEELETVCVDGFRIDLFSLARQIQQETIKAIRVEPLSEKWKGDYKLGHNACVERQDNLIKKLEAEK